MSPSTSRVSDIFSTLRIRKSISSLKSKAASIKSSKSNKRASSSSYTPYAVYQQTMFPTILKDADVTQKLLDVIIDAPGGRRSVSRLARTCKAFCEPALNVLWRELDSLIPILALFPPHLLKRVRRPGLGLAKAPLDEDWTKILTYGERVRNITYTERANNIAASIFPIIDECRPRTYILPHLQQLTWRAETAAGLGRCSMFLNPELQDLILEIGTNFKQLDTFLKDMSSRTHLHSFSFSSPTSLPDSFTELLHSQDTLEKLVLVAPGALSPGVGKWASSLPKLQSLQLDLTGRSVIAVEGFFDDIPSGPGYATPSDDGSSDSGVFSEEDAEIDFTEIKKSSLRLTGHLPSKAAFSQLRQLQLSGEAANIAVFLKHLTSSLTQLDLVIEDPPDRMDWQDLSVVMCERFGKTIQSLRVTATSSSRFSDLIRSTSRAEPPTRQLSLEHFTAMPTLIRLEIDLPESIIFHNSDLAHLAEVCPNLEVLKLCPVARFPSASSPPHLTLQGIHPLTTRCKRLHTLALVLNARTGTENILMSRQVSSRSLLRLHLGHSWVGDPLHVTILLSHLAPHLDNLKWFHEKNRPGFVEANARAWTTVSEYLPHLQNMRLMERQPVPQTVIVPTTSEKGVDATMTTVDQEVDARPSTVESGVQSSPSLISRMIEAKPELCSVFVEATPVVAEQSVETEIELESSVIKSEGKETMEPLEYEDPMTGGEQSSYFVALPSIVSGMVSSACKTFFFLPLYIPCRIFDMSIAAYHARMGTADGKVMDTEKPSRSNTESSTSSAELLDISPEKHHEHYEHTTNELQNSIISSQDTKAGDQVTERNFGWAVKEDRGVAKEGNGEQTGHASLFGWQTRPRPYKLFSSPAKTRNMAEQKKQERDFTPEVDVIIPETTSLAQAGKLQEALDKLLTLEKQTRNASDLSSTTRLGKAAIERCYEARDYTLLNSNLSLLSKKHGQLKGVVQALVEQAMGWLEEINEREGIEKWLELIETLRSITEGKIFLETPRARVTLLLSHYHESLVAKPTPTEPPPKESLQTASDLLSDLQVETYSSMERREKTEFILEQMRLLIAVARSKDAEVGKEGKDSLGGGEAEWVKVRVGGRKINEEFLKEKSNEDLKLKYYDLMIQHALQNSAYLDVAKYYYKVWETPSIKEDGSDKGKAALEHIVYYVVLASHNNEQSDMLHHLFADPALIKLELHFNLVKCFVTRELMRWPGIETLYGPSLRTTPVFASDKRWEDLHTRVIEHNIRVVAEYYTRITLPRLTSLLDLTPQATEETLARLVVSGTIWARIDRPSGVVNFRAKRSAEDVMNDWSSDMQKLLGLVEKTWMGMNAAQAAQSRVKA